jgi:putative transposase
VVPGLPHHITQRGNRDAEVFTDATSRQVYMSLVAKYATRHGVRLWAYCLMTNHVHFIAVPKAETSLALMLRETHTAYANWFNKQTSSPGHLWHARFFSCPMDESHLWAGVHYVERNPVHAGLAKRAEDYPWSSAAAHCGLREDPLLARDFPPGQVVRDWRAWLADEDVALTEVIRERTRVGRPAGSQTFVEQIEKDLGRSVRPNKRGPKSPTRSRPSS